MANIASIGSRESVAESLTGLAEEQQAWLNLLMENPDSDDMLVAGLNLYLEQASKARFLNVLKLKKCAVWLGENAPGRLQIRLSETARSSQHPAYQAFKEALSQSGGLERAYPKANV